MNTIIEKLSQIEEKSNKIIADGTAKKKPLPQNMRSAPKTLAKI